MEIVREWERRIPDPDPNSQSNPDNQNSNSNCDQNNACSQQDSYQNNQNQTGIQQIFSNSNAKVKTAKS